MSKFDEAVMLYKSEMMDKMGVKIDANLLTAVTKALGPSIYNEDSSRVSCSDPEEMMRVKNNFLIKKLGMKDGPHLDTAMKEVCHQMGKSNRNKYRAAFYYLLVKKFNKESLFI